MATTLDPYRDQKAKNSISHARVTPAATASKVIVVTDKANDPREPTHA